MPFIWPQMLLALCLIPVLVALYVRLLRRRRQAVVDLQAFGIVQSRSGGRPGMRRHLPFVMFLIGLTLLLLSLARPEMVVGLPRSEGTVILAFDVSNSMAADDFEPSRVEAAKAAAQVFVEAQPSTIMIGVVAFSGGGLIVQQPTNDQAAILDTIERLNAEGGTSLGQGIFTALNAIAGEPIGFAAALDEAGNSDESLSLEQLPALEIADFSSAVIVLLTDGENTGPPEPLDLAQLAAEAGVRIYPVGIGGREGAILEIDGFNVVTQLDETTLQEIAGITNGSYYHAQDAASLQEIYQDIDLHLTIAVQMMEVTAILVAAAMLFLLVGGALSLLWFGRAP